MATKKKNKKKAPQKPAPQNMSPRQYIQSGRARTLEILECLVSADWQEAGISTVIIARQHKTGNITWGTYLLDTFCLGVKDLRRRLIVLKTIMRATKITLPEYTLLCCP